MQQRTRVLMAVLLAIVGAAATFVVSRAQEATPVAAMFRDDLKREQALGLSFQPIELPAVGAVPPLQVYLSVGDLERAFDTPGLRPSAAIVPTNTGLVVTAASPSSQRVLMQRIQRMPAVMADLQGRIGLRRSQAASKDGNVLEIGVDAFLAELPRKSQNSRLVSALGVPDRHGLSDRRRRRSARAVRAGSHAQRCGCVPDGTGRCGRFIRDDAAARRGQRQDAIEGCRFRGPATSEGVPPPERRGGHCAWHP